jgi:hypothetical protein
MSSKSTKKSCVQYIVQNKLSSHSKAKLQKMNVEELTNIIKNVQVTSSEQKVRPERILRELDNLSSSEEDDEVVDEQQPQSQQPQPQPQPQKQQQEEEEEEEDEDDDEEEEAKPKPKEQKINCRNITLPENEKVKKLSVTEIKKVLRKMFSVYNKDLKLLCKDYKKDVITQEEFLKDFDNVKNEYISELEEFIDSQPKVSDKVYEYVNNALESACKIIEDALYE